MISTPPMPTRRICRRLPAGTPTDPYERISRIRFLESRFRCVDRVNDPGFGQVKELQQPVHALPRHALGVASPRQPLPPDPESLPVDTVPGAS